LKEDASSLLLSSLFRVNLVLLQTSTNLRNAGELDLTPIAGKCGECGKLTGYRCGRCHVEFYCCRAHQRAAWPLHSERCKAPERPPYVYQVPGSGSSASLQLAVVGGSSTNDEASAGETLSAGDLRTGMHVVVAPSSSHFATYGAARAVVERVIQPYGGPAGRIKLRFLDGARKGTPVALSACDLCLAGTNTTPGGVSDCSHGGGSNASSRDGAAHILAKPAPLRRQKSNVSASWSYAMENSYLSPLAVATSGLSNSTLNPLQLSSSSSNSKRNWNQSSSGSAKVSKVEPDQAALASLVALGFDCKNATEALVWYKNDLEEAADWLLGGGGGEGSNGSSRDAYAADDESNQATSKLAASVASRSLLFADDDDEKEDDEATTPWATASSCRDSHSGSSSSAFPWPGDSAAKREVATAQALLASGCLYHHEHALRGGSHGERFSVEAVRDGRANGLGVRLRVTRAASTPTLETSTVASTTPPPTGSTSSAVHLTLSDQQVRELAETMLASAPHHETTTCNTSGTNATTTALAQLLDPALTSDAVRVAQLVPLLKLVPPRVCEASPGSSDPFECLSATPGSETSSSGAESGAITDLAATSDAWLPQRLAVETSPGQTFAVSDDVLDPLSGLHLAAEPATVAATAAAMDMLSLLNSPPLPSSVSTRVPTNNSSGSSTRDGNGGNVWSSGGDDCLDVLSGKNDEDSLNVKEPLLARYATHVNEEPSHSDETHGGSSAAAHAEKIAMLEAMGFGADDAAAALAKCNGQMDEVSARAWSIVSFVVPSLSSFEPFCTSLPRVRLSTEAKFVLRRLPYFMFRF